MINSLSFEDQRLLKALLGSVADSDAAPSAEMQDESDLVRFAVQQSCARVCTSDLLTRCS